MYLLTLGPIPKDTTRIIEETTSVTALLETYNNILKACAQPADPFHMLPGPTGEGMAPNPDTGPLFDFIHSDPMAVLYTMDLVAAAGSSGSSWLLDEQLLLAKRLSEASWPRSIGGKEFINKAQWDDWCGRISTRDWGHAPVYIPETAVCREHPDFGESRILDSWLFLRTDIVQAPIELGILGSLRKFETRVNAACDGWSPESLLVYEF